MTSFWGPQLFACHLSIGATGFSSKSMVKSPYLKTKLWFYCSSSRWVVYWEAVAFWALYNSISCFCHPLGDLGDFSSRTAKGYTGLEHSGECVPLTVYPDISPCILWVLFSGLYSPLISMRLLGGHCEYIPHRFDKQLHWQKRRSHISAPLLTIVWGPSIRQYNV